MLTGTRDYDALLRDADRTLCGLAETVALLHERGRLDTATLDQLHDAVSRRHALRRDYLLQ